MRAKRERWYVGALVGHYDFAPTKHTEGFADTTTVKQIL